MELYYIFRNKVNQFIFYLNGHYDISHSGAGPHRNQSATGIMAGSDPMKYLFTEQLHKNVSMNPHDTVSHIKL